MASMTLALILFAAVAGTPVQQAEARAYPGARMEGRMAVTIISGARIAAGEVQHAALPPIQDSEVRTPDGGKSRARLVEFQ